MKKRNRFLIFAIVISLGFFCFTLNISFAESLQVGEDKAGKYNFSSPAAEENFIKYGQINNVLSLATTVKTVLSSPDDSNFAVSPQRSSGCSTSCSTRCSTNCTRSCSTYCSTNCTRSCSTYCKLDHSTVCE